MKKHSSTVIVMLRVATLAQTLTSVSPNSTYRGQPYRFYHGANTLFQSPSTSRFYLE